MKTTIVVEITLEAADSTAHEIQEAFLEMLPDNLGYVRLIGAQIVNGLVDENDVPILTT